MNRQILQGDVLEKLKEIPDETFDCIISSYPYYRVRDYGVEGQIGLEDTVFQYMEVIGKVTKELKRVLKKTGTCWINLGDSYGSHHSDEDNKMVADKQEQKPVKGFEKSRFGVPERFYINCIDDGWIARNHIPWYKSNAMPSSVKDRFTNKWESIFFLVKSQRYFFNLDAVRIKPQGKTVPFNVRVRDAKNGTLDQKYGKMQKATTEEIDNYGDDRTKKKQDNTLDSTGKHEIYGNDPENKGRVRDHLDMGVKSHTKGKNPGDVFFINPKPFPEAHFATFPVELPLTILKCGCPPDGIVLDPFFGAGTVGVAAEMLGMKWTGIELNKEYITMAQNRLSKFRNQKMDVFA